METSINTSKRKFQSLLDNISNTARNDPALKHLKSEHSTRDRPRKRLRLGQSQLQKDDQTIKIAELKRNADADSTSRRNGHTRKCYEKPVTSRGERDKPLAGAYAPWSRELLLKRLSTFADPHLWAVKPEAINELQWAKRGWICEDKETVACKGLCEQRLVIDLNPSQRDNELSESENENENENENEQAHDIRK